MSSARVRQKTPFGPARPNARADAVDVETSATHAREDPSQSSHSRHLPSHLRAPSIRSSGRRLGVPEPGADGRRSSDDAYGRQPRLPALRRRRRQRQLTRLGNAAGGAGLALLMEGRRGRGRRVVRPRGRPLPRELRRRAARTAGAGRSGRSSRSCWHWDARRGGGTLGARRGRRRTRSRRSAATPARSRCSFSATTSGARVLADAIRDPRRLSAGRRRRSRLPRRQRRGRIHRAVEAVLKSFERRDEYLEDLPGRRHGARPAGARRAAAASRPSSSSSPLLAAVESGVDQRRRGHLVLTCPVRLLSPAPARALDQLTACSGGTRRDLGSPEPR